MDLSPWTGSTRDLARAIAKSAETSKLVELRDMASKTLRDCLDIERGGVQLFVDECNAELARRTAT